MLKNEFRYFSKKTKSDCRYFAKKKQNEFHLKPSSSANRKSDNQNFCRQHLSFSTLQNNVYTVKHNDGDDVPSSHHPNNQVPNNSDPSPQDGPQ